MNLWEWFLQPSTHTGDQLNAAINTTALLACLFLSAEYINIVRVRKPPYPWASFAVSLLLFTIACDRLAKVTAPDCLISGWQYLAQCCLNFFVLTSAALIPRVRRAAYKRPRFEQLQKVNEELKHSQALLRSYLDEAPILAYIKDCDGAVTHISAGFRRLLGGEMAESLIGKKYLWGDEQKSKERDELVLKGEGTKKSIEEIKTSDGPGTIIDIRFPLLAPDQKLMLGGIAVDLTNELKRKNRIEVFASIVDFSPDAIYSQDREGKIQTWNPAAEKMFGLTREEAIGKKVQIFLPSQDQHQQKIIDALFAQVSSSPQYFESQCLTSSGDITSVMVACAYVDSAAPGVVVIIKDISAQKAMADKINTLHDQLENKVHELSETNINLQKARDEALEAAAMKSAFVANISHELRTPLSGILGMSELLTHEKLDQDSLRLVRLLEQSAQELLQVVEDILDLAKLEAGKITIEKEFFSLSQLLENCAERFSVPLETKKLQWKTKIAADVPDQIYTDRTVLQRILNFLIANAINFTNKGSVKIKIETESMSEDRLQLKFSVTDTGVGMDEDRLPLLFTPFARVAQSPDGLVGKGLGLVLCKHFTALLHGTIGCKSKKNSGSTFWFTASVDKGDLNYCNVETGSHQLLNPRELQRFCVLSVDDSPVVSQLTMRQLNIIGINCNSATTGAEAIERAGEAQYDVILMDVHLPDMTGYAAARAIRKKEEESGQSKSIIIALTGCTPEELREQEDANVMDAFLEKPVSIDTLRSSLISTLGQKEKSFSDQSL